jgi:hypothetical protein
MAFALRQPYRRTATRTGDEAVAPARPSVARTAAARGAWAMGSVMLTIARLVRAIAGVVFLVIAVAIALRLLGANQGNSIVHDIHDAGSWLVGPFKNVFSLKHPKANMAANWGLAAVVYLIVGGFIASLIARIAPRGVHPSRPVVAD